MDADKLMQVQLPSDIARKIEQIREVTEQYEQAEQYEQQRESLAQRFVELHKRMIEREQPNDVNEAITSIQRVVTAQMRAESTWDGSKFNESFIDAIIYETEHRDIPPKFSDKMHPLKCDSPEYQLVVDKSVNAVIESIKERGKNKTLDELAEEFGTTRQTFFSNLPKHPDRASVDTVSCLVAASGMTLEELRGTAQPEQFTDDVTWKYASQVDVMPPELIMAVYEVMDEETKKIVTGILQRELRHIQDVFETSRLKLHRSMLANEVIGKRDGKQM